MKTAEQTNVITTTVAVYLRRAWHKGGKPLAIFDTQEQAEAFVRNRVTYWHQQNPKSPGRMSIGAHCQADYVIAHQLA